MRTRGIAVVAAATLFAWADGTIDRSERAMLDRLRVRLGLSAEDAMAAEAKASRS